VRIFRAEIFLSMIRLSRPRMVFSAARVGLTVSAGRRVQRAEAPLELVEDLQNEPTDRLIERFLVKQRERLGSQIGALGKRHQGPVKLTGSSPEQTDHFEVNRPDKVAYHCRQGGRTPANPEIDAGVLVLVGRVAPSPWVA
jgi:hypothetical protein